MLMVARAFFASLAMLLAAPAIVGSTSEAALQVGRGLVGLDGRPVDPLAPAAGVRATAFIFTTSDCPIANRYAPEIERLFTAYRAKGIRFWLVYVNPREDAAAIREHARQFSLSLPILRDVDHTLVGRYGISVTPETAVVDAAGTLAYRGRIDDRNAELAVSRPMATRREFENALAALAAGRAVPEPRTKAVGCYVADFKPISFARDVAPIVFDKCAACHQPAGPAPFSLLSYADVRQRATQIIEVTERRYMPPWKAAPQAEGFVGQKRLSDDEITVLQRWVVASQIQQKMTAEDVIGLETMLQDNPTDAELHDDVAVLYLALGRAQEAVSHFRATTALRPGVAAVHFNLATALSVTGELDAAVASYQEALRRRPDYGIAHNNLGSVLAARGRLDEAIVHFRDAVRYDAGNVQAHRNLAWHLATAPSPSGAEQREAVAAGERAAALTAWRDPQVLDALAAAYAAAGDFARAVATIERALTVSDAAQAGALRERLRLYRQNRRLPSR